MKKNLIISIIFLLHGCGLITLPVQVATAPVWYPITLVAHESAKPYNNPDYVVTDECAKDATRAIIKITGAPAGNILSMLYIKFLMTQAIHTAPTTVESKVGFSGVNIINYILTPNTLSLLIDDDKRYPTIDITPKDSGVHYKFDFSESGSNLEINLILYEEEKDDVTVTVNNPETGSEDLTNCKI